MLYAIQYLVLSTISPVTVLLSLALLTQLEVTVLLSVKLLKRLAGNGLVLFTLFVTAILNDSALANVVFISMINVQEVTVLCIRVHRMSS